MVDYALGDRGTLTIVTDNYYEAETLQVFQELHVNREQSWQGKARLVPEPDNPYEANSIAVYVGDHKVGRLNRDDSANYWNAITRVVASGFSPTAQLQLNAIALRADSGPHIKSVGKLFLSSPTMPQREQLFFLKVLQSRCLTRMDTLNIFTVFCRQQVKDG